MLSRASKKRLQREAYNSWQKSRESLILPWLCPTPIWARPARKTSTTAPSRSAKRPKPVQTCLATSNLKITKETPRRLASAAAIKYDTPDDHFVPFERTAPTYNQLAINELSWHEQDTPSALRNFDPASPMIIKETLATKQQRFRAKNAMSGAVSEIISTLRACIQVGRLRRAAALMRRLNEIYKPDTSELILMHNDYLWELVSRAKQTKDQAILKEIYKWFEVDLTGGGVIPDATTYALMVQAALQGIKSKNLDRTIKRYMALADESGLRDAVMQTLLRTLDEQDIGRITQIAPPPTHNEESSVPESLSNPAPAALQPISSAPKEDFEIRSKEQKGLGLITLKKALLSLFEQTTSSADEGEGVTDDEKRRALAMQRQEQLESGIYESAIERWRTERDILKKSGRDPALRSATVGALMWSWHENLTSLIKEEIRMANKAEEKKNKTIQEKERCLYGPFLQLLPAEKLSAITILTIMMTFTRFRIDERGIKLNVFVGQLGSAVQDESLAETFKTSDDYDFWQNMTKAWSFQKLSSFMKRRQACGLFTKLTNRKDVAERYEESKWNASIRGRVSTILISLIIDAAKIDVVNKDSISEVKTQVTQPVFFHSYRYFKGKKLGIIRLNKAVAKILTTEPVHSVLTKGLPMLVEPKPWIGYRNGAFLKHSSTAVRNKAYDVELLRYARAASENGDMDQVFAGLNVLARTPWRINHRVFEIMVEAWNTGEKLGKIPAENPPMDYPPEPAPSEDEGIRQKWRQGLWKVQHRVSGIHSQRCFMNFQLEIARGFLNETFYFPHNIDFRGRAYPMVPYFNHMGADPNRSLLIFAKGKELGENGLKWLEIHLATLYGFDKSSFEERQKFTRDHLAEIYDSANNPLDGKRWWLQAEDPWQCLSACIELQSALNEPDPRRFISHLPIHQDGSCNGLQHYAALGGDAIGARQVNLDPGDRPSDLYSAVADSVRESVLEDAQDGNELAICLKTYINRKVVKQTVMTNVYGVTFIGAKIQVERQLEDLVTDFPDTPEINISQAALYIASKIFFALSNMFNGAQDIQRWLGDCAGRISRAVTPEQIETIQNQHDGKARPLSPYNLAPLGKKEYTKDHDLFQSVVIWTTPLKMPVVQPYRVVPPTKMQTNFQTLNLILPTLSSPTHRRKQLQAFPPNFIHSLDATHMMLTALKSDEVGITFASVHDSFWTHPADVDTMNEIIRDAFIRMHSEDIIGRLRLEFVARYKGCMQLVNVKSRGPLGNKIKVWRQENRVKGSPRKIYELLLEHRRSVLLASDKLEERLEGESMMTPGKLLQENPDETDLETSEDLDKARIGQVPPSIPETRDAGIDDPNVIEHKIQDEGVDDLDAMEFESESVTQPLSDAEETLVDVEPIAVKKGPKKSTDRTVWVWAPISFPPIPSKGNFDVTKARKSKYFFS